jgi:hypothetical protein
MSIFLTDIAFIPYTESISAARCGEMAALSGRMAWFRALHGFAIIDVFVGETLVRGHGFWYWQ